MPDYKCLECGESLDCVVDCVKHNMEIKHQCFEVPGTDIQTIIKLA